MHCLAFVTSEARGEVQAATQRDILNIFVPTTPNPTSGFLIFLPREEVIPLDMSIEEGIKYVVSGGFVVPAYAGKPEAAEPVISNGGTSKAALPPTPTKPETRPTDGEESSAR